MLGIVPKPPRSSYDLTNGEPQKRAKRGSLCRVQGPATSGSASAGMAPGLKQKDLTVPTPGQRVLEFGWVPNTAPRRTVSQNPDGAETNSAL